MPTLTLKQNLPIKFSSPVTCRSALAGCSACALPSMQPHAPTSAMLGTCSPVLRQCSQAVAPPPSHAWTRMGTGGSGSSGRAERRAARRAACAAAQGPRGTSPSSQWCHARRFFRRQQRDPASCSRCRIKRADELPRSDGDSAKASLRVALPLTPRSSTPGAGGTRRRRRSTQLRLARGDPTVARRVPTSCPAGPCAPAARPLWPLPRTGAAPWQGRSARCRWTPGWRASAAMATPSAACPGTRPSAAWRRRAGARAAAARRRPGRPQSAGRPARNGPAPRPGRGRPAKASAQSHPRK